MENRNYSFFFAEQLNTEQLICLLIQTGEIGVWPYQSVNDYTILSCITFCRNDIK